MTKPSNVMIGKYQSGHATCVLKRSAQIPVEMRDGIRELSALETPVEHRKHGDASKLLHDVCEEADRQNLVILLHCEPFGDIELGASQLQAWYERFGFMVIQDEPKLMARMVGATPRVLNKATAAIGRAIEAM